MKIADGFRPEEDVPPPDAGFSREAAQQGRASRIRSLLVVDPRTDTRRVVEVFLARRGYHVTGANSIDTALRRAEHVPLDIVLTELGLPDGPVERLVEQLKRLQPHVKVVAIQSPEWDAWHFNRDDFDRCVAKPLRLPTLESVLAELG